MAANKNHDIEYAGFWIRVWASIIDSILVGLITVPILLSCYGTQYFLDSEKTLNGPVDFFVSWVLPPIAVILFWIYKLATPGKMIISSKIVDARTGDKPTTAQFIGRYFAYLISGLPLGLGFFWVAIDKKKQGWHDKLAGTVVVRKKNRGPEPVIFEARR